MGQTYRRVALTTFIVLLIGCGFYLLIEVAEFFLLVFAGILLAVIFCGLTEWIVRKFNFRRGWALLLVVVVVLGAISSIGWFIAPTVIDQLSEMRETIPKALARVREWVAGHSWGRNLVKEIPAQTSDLMPRRGTLLSRISNIFSSTLGVLANIILVIMTALFFSVNPRLYTHGFVKLFAPHYRTRMLDVLAKCYATLKLWLLAMLLSMTIIGVSTAIGYTLLGLPLAITLGVLSFFLAFIPTIGAYGAAVPAALVALTQDPKTALYVILMYIGIQMLETYLITPIIFQRTVKLPPALLLFNQVLFGILLGALGLLLAAPILTVAMVLIRELYIKDVLEQNGVGKGLISEAGT
ncbi:AI-2E family transporter [Pontibacter sp. KCTC 32443]|uniref:AI-2E family transporter n=1 Tax=Pontibacter TaxID=323449 RepID=UPI00164D8C1D|nr:MULTISPECIES: AI-2E family transporter [Pontibacter]MBC5772842.1 AI-2E family transporter [Pontibacter sp. KCTC 32443]